MPALFNFEKDYLLQIGFDKEEIRRYERKRKVSLEGLKVLRTIAETVEERGILLIEGKKDKRLFACILYATECWYAYPSFYINAEKLFFEALKDKEGVDNYTDLEMFKTNLESLFDNIRERIYQTTVHTLLINEFNVENFYHFLGKDHLKVFLSEVNDFIGENPAKVIFFLKEKTKPNRLKEKIFRNILKRNLFFTL
jgi:hypothetical protein